MPVSNLNSQCEFTLCNACARVISRAYKSPLRLHSRDIMTLLFIYFLYLSYQNEQEHTLVTYLITNELVASV